MPSTLHRYFLVGMLLDAEAGAHVLLVTADDRLAPVDALDQLVRLAHPASVRRVVRRLGHEALELAGGGRVRILRVGQLRGHEAPVVVLAPGVDLEADDVLALTIGARETLQAIAP